MKESADSRAISNDISEMEEMIDGYIAFAAGEGDEAPQDIAIEVNGKAAYHTSPQKS